jgi:hypothetical protein
MKYFYKPDKRPGLKVKKSTAKRLNNLCNDYEPNKKDITTDHLYIGSGWGVL